MLKLCLVEKEYLYRVKGRKLTTHSQNGQDDSSLHGLNIQKCLNTEVKIKEPFILDKQCLRRAII